MAKLKQQVLSELKAWLGDCVKLGGSNSLYEFGDGRLRVYFRYSKDHGDRAF